MPDRDASYRQLLDERHVEMRDMLEQILEQAKITNGRVRAAEVKIAVLQMGYALGTFLAAAWFFDWVKR